MIRLDKYLADMSVGTRSEVKKLIRGGRVIVNDETVKSPELKILENRDIVQVDGMTVSFHKYEYFMLNKPMDCVTARTDAGHRTVLDYITDSSRKDLSPVGRLDIDTEGLLLITNDGEMSHRLLSPRSHVPKTYMLIAMGRVTADDVAALENGIDIGDENPTLPAKVSEPVYHRYDEITFYHSKLNRDVISHRQNRDDIWTTLQLTISEGRYHQVKRMMAAVGKPVVYLKRISMGSLTLDESLNPGEYRRLTEEEINSLKNLLTKTEKYGKI